MKISGANLEKEGFVSSLSQKLPVFLIVNKGAILAPFLGSQVVSFMNPISLEEAYKDFVQNLTRWAPDGCIEVNLQLLQNLGLLKNWEVDSSGPEFLTQQFHVIETHEKVTLFNEQFAVWIIPQTQTEIPSTLVMIALIQNTKPHLEIIYSTSGVYNTPKYILKLLQHFMNEVIDTESVISVIDKNNS